MPDDFARHFSKNHDGSWICTSAATLDGPLGQYCRTKALVSRVVLPLPVLRESRGRRLLAFGFVDEVPGPQEDPSGDLLGTVHHGAQVVRAHAKSVGQVGNPARQIPSASERDLLKRSFQHGPTPVEKSCLMLSNVEVAGKSARPDSM